MRTLTRDNLVPLDRRYRVFEPAITVRPGETIVVETINHMTPVVETEAELHAHGTPGYVERLETGPIRVDGARPGDMLAVRIEAIDIVGHPHAHGWGPLGDEHPQQPMIFPLHSGACRLPGGADIPIAPMVGDIYTTPPEKWSYYDHGGNMDFTEVRPGNILYLPVYHDGGLLVLGDVHAVQGDGEIYGEGAETAADVTVTIDIDRTYGAARPLVETPERLHTLASRGGLYEGLRLAVRDMTELISRVFGLEQDDAYVYATLGGAVRLAGSLSTRRLVEERCIVALSVLLDPLRRARAR